MSIEEKEIVEITGCAAADAAMIEYIIREEIFHSTLDWQTPAQFRRAARKAAKILAEDRPTYEAYFAMMRAQFQKMRQASECVSYEI